MRSTMVRIHIDCIYLKLTKSFFFFLRRQQKIQLGFHVKQIKPKEKNLYTKLKTKRSCKKKGYGKKTTNRSQGAHYLERQKWHKKRHISSYYH